MKGNYPLSRAKLYRALLELIRHPEVKLSYQALKWGGHCEWGDIIPPTNIRIKVDANSGEASRFVVHELLHVILYPMLFCRFDDTLEEVFVVAMDTYMWAYIEKSPARHAEWVKAVKKKLDEGLVDIPLEDQVKR
jgi:hypothetical protein